MIKEQLILNIKLSDNGCQTETLVRFGGKAQTGNMEAQLHHETMAAL
jgi:hypothetical protein